MDLPTTSPYRVDRNTLRTQQASIVALTTFAFILGEPVGPWVVLFVGAVMAVSTVYPPLALFKQLHRRVLKPAGLLGSDIHVEDPMPHTFAQTMGAGFMFAAFAAFLLGASAVGWALAWLVVALAFINLTVQFCAGCFVYYQLDRLGLLPQSIGSTRAAH